MWEWRVFLPSSEGFVPDIWKLLGTGPWIVHPEKRTDIYVACSALSGVKLRSKKTLEVKLRSERHESGAERWDKVLHTTLSYDQRNIQSLGAGLAHKLTMCKDAFSLSHHPSPERQQAVCDTLMLSTSPPPVPHVFTLNKQRVSHHKYNVFLEQTDIIVERHQEPKWRTIAIEGELESILTVLQKKIKPHMDQPDEVILQDYLIHLTGEPCGYPQFILNLKETLLS